MKAYAKRRRCSEELASATDLSLQKTHGKWICGNVLISLKGQLLRTTTMRPRSTMECSQQDAWTTNRSIVVASRAKTFLGRQTNSGSTQSRDAQMDGGVIGCHQCITSHSGNAPASHDMRPTSPGFVHHLHPCPHPIHHSHSELHTYINCD